MNKQAVLTYGYVYVYPGTLPHLLQTTTCAGPVGTAAFVARRNISARFSATSLASASERSTWGASKNQGTLLQTKNYMSRENERTRERERERGRPGGRRYYVILSSAHFENYRRVCICMYVCMYAVEQRSQNLNRPLTIGLELCKHPRTLTWGIVASSATPQVFLTVQLLEFIWESPKKGDPKIVP